MVKEAIKKTTNNSYNWGGKPPPWERPLDQLVLKNSCVKCPTNPVSGKVAEVEFRYAKGTKRSDPNKALTCSNGHPYIDYR